MTAWHLDPRVLDMYSDGAIDHAAAASVEAHLLGCAACRLRLAGDDQDAARLAGIWDDVVDVLDTPRPRALDRLLLAVGVPAPTSRMLALTPAFRLPFLASAAFALAFAAAAATAVPERGVVLFLIVAPLLPVAGVVVAFGRGLNKMFDYEAVAPFSSLRLLVLRTLAVVVTTAGLSALTDLAVPALPGMSAWLCPALAMCAVTLAAGCWFSLERSAAVLGAAWTFGVLVATDAGRTVATAFGPATQVTCAVITALAAALILRDERSHDGGNR